MGSTPDSHRPFDMRVDSEVPTTQAYLIVQDVSFRYVQNVTRYIHRQLRSYFGDSAALVLTSEIDDVRYADGSIVFVIGENFRTHQRKPGCKYIYLNFSVVEVMGSPFKLSRIGWSAIRRKKRMLQEKIGAYDAVLDYFPPQTRILERRLAVPVFGFAVGVDLGAASNTKPLAAREYDLCFVGGMSPRRETVLADLSAEGLSLSPNSKVVFEEEAAKSRLCLNIHAYRSNHLETPRILGALASGTPVLTEPSFGLDTLMPPSCAAIARTDQLVRKAKQLLNSPTELQSLCDRSQAWYHTTYLPDAAGRWRKLLETLER
ncbi:glycosyltransferase [Qingshengfaniella alkalisoli]|uniref:Glycosyltransferase family 1 protein n=1 Tax=Qingshengfaniella alkalisoli TaxID=2599296 RepID=A0A5B8J3R6_9RHOB|nr:glycosyltransferase [Qingshengfaniella alkalisoli]QDY71348.1 glycosyltransferase family 1 protein [Qingshengfaniella alkalisoli]